MQYMKKIFSLLVYVAILPLLLYNIVIIVKSIVVPGETPSFMGIKSYVIASGSMEPELQIGDVVLIKKADEERLDINDIISFRSGQSIVTHRIVDIDWQNACYVTKGDSNNVVDKNCVTINDIEGKLYRVVPKIGQVSLFLQKKEIIILVIIGVYVALFFVPIKNK